ncbi:hypothetical protein V2J09_010710 [Rumex salicifolius]
MSQRLVGGAIPSIHHEVEPGNVLGVVTGQVEGGLSDVLWLRNHPFENRRLVYDPVQHALLHPNQIRYERSGHGGRSHRVHPNPVLPQLRAEALHEPHHGMLGRHVRVGPVPGHERHHA